MLIGVPDVRRYLSVFWGPLMMLLKRFYYLSDGRAPLVEDLWPPEVSKKLLNRPKSAPTCAIGKHLFFLLDLSENRKVSCDPLTARQSSFGSKASSFVKIEYLRTSGTLCPALSLQAVLLFFTLFSIFLKTRF